MKRQTLYEQVWSTPMVQLAQEYGITDKGLAKICARLSIPVPGRGYWRKKETGIEVSPEPLPPLQPGQRDFASYRRSAAPEEGEIRLQVVDFESRPENRVKVSSGDIELGEEAELIRLDLQKAKPDESGILVGKKIESSVIKVSPDRLERALRILDALYRAFKARGFTLGPHESAKQIGLSIGGGRVSFLLEEVTERRQKDLSPAQLKDKARNPWKYTYPVYHRVPTGKMSLRLTEPSWYSGRRNWTDGARQKVEDCLNKFMVIATCAAAGQKRRKLELERAEAERREHERLAEERRKKREAERRRLWALVTESLCWQQSQLIRAYARAAQEAAEKLALDTTTDADFAEWIAWANVQADRLDPLAENAYCTSEDRYTAASYGRPDLEKELPGQLEWTRLLRRSVGTELSSDPWSDPSAWWPTGRRF